MRAFRWALVAVAIVATACAGGGDDGGDRASATAPAATPAEQLTSAVDATLATSFRFESVVTGPGQPEVRLAVTEYQPPDRLHQRLEAATALGAAGPLSGGSDQIPTENITVGNQRWVLLEDGTWEVEELDVAEGEPPRDLQWLAVLRDPLSVEESDDALRASLPDGVTATVRVEGGLVVEVGIELPGAPSVVHRLSDHGDVAPIEAPEAPAAAPSS